MLAPELLTAATAVFKKHSDPGYEESVLLPYDWRTPVLQKLREGDVDGMKKAAAPTLQFNLIRLAHESKNEKIQLAATQFALSQAGHGPIQKMEHSLSFSKLPAEQLLAVIQSKLSRIQKLNPLFDPSKLLADHANGEPVDLTPAPAGDIMEIPSTQEEAPKPDHGD